MNWYEKINKISERSLYHGTIIDHANSISEIGLCPTVGQFVIDAYDDDYQDAGINVEEYFTPLSFATDKDNISKAHTAMVYHISKKLQKSFGEVTLNDIRNNGMIVKIKGCPGSTKPPSGWEQRQDTEEWDGEAQERGLHSVETEDYYTEYPTGGTKKGYVQLITGSTLIRFLKRMDQI